MPTLEPWVAGLTISGSPRRSSASVEDPAALAQHHEVAASATPTACARRLVRSLSMPMAEPMHAAAGVGNAEILERALQRAVLAARPVQRDPDALDARARAARASGRSRGSKAMRIDAAALRAPPAPRCRDSSEISRSLESPPSSTATRPNSRRLAARAASCAHRRAASWRPRRISAPRSRRRCALRARARRRARAATVACTCRISCSRSLARGMAVVDDEVGVLLRHRRIADAIALEPGGLDQARGVIAGRVGEHRAAAPLADRLRRRCAAQQRAHAVARCPAPRLEVQLRGEEPLLARRAGALDVAVADAILLRRARVRAAAAVDGLDRAARAARSPRRRRRHSSPARRRACPECRRRTPPWRQAPAARTGARCARTARRPRRRRASASDARCA